MKIVLAMPCDNKFYKVFKENFEYLGIDFVLLRNNQQYFKLSLLQSIIKIFRKIFLGDRFYKNRLCEELSYIHHKKILKELKSPSELYDFSLVIRPDLFRDEILESIKSISKKNLAYQWDGLERFPNVISKINMFDKFYVFDKSDVLKYKGTHLLNNFYFDCYNENQLPVEYDVYYVGAYDNRIDDVIKVCTELYALGLVLNINILCSNRKRKKINHYPFFKFPKKAFSYKENINNLKKSRVILDFKHKNSHAGLSFRPFEALGFDKKIITTNEEILNYDFYNSNNCLVYGDNSSLEKFINSPCERSVFKEKYSFTSWLKEINNKL